MPVREMRLIVISWIRRLAIEVAEAMAREGYLRCSNSLTEIIILGDKPFSWMAGHHRESRMEWLKCQGRMLFRHLTISWVIEGTKLWISLMTHPTLLLRTSWMEFMGLRQTIKMKKPLIVKKVTEQESNLLQCKILTTALLHTPCFITLIKIN